MLSSVQIENHFQSTSLLNLMAIPKLECTAGQLGQWRLNEIYGPTTYLLPTGRLLETLYSVYYPVGIGSISIVPNPNYVSCC